MQNTIFEFVEFHKIETCNERYASLVEAIVKNHNMEIIAMYESKLSMGLFIHIKLKISIPTNGVYEDLDVRSDEEIMMHAKTDYPLSAPVVLFVRTDFPTSRIPHLNLGVSDSDIKMLNPCLYRGDINEWFYQKGAKAFCERVNEWFSDLVNGELMNGDGFETIRHENPAGIVEVDFDYLLEIIQAYRRNYGSCILGMKRKTDRYLKILNQEYAKKLSEDILPCIFVFDRENVMSDYISQPLDKENDLKIFPCERRLCHGIRKLISKYYETEKIDRLKELLVIMAVKRPMQVIGGFSEYEFVAVRLLYDFRISTTIESCSVQKMVIIQSLNKKMSERLSGTESLSKKPIIFLGCGALGSKISMNLARMGYTEQHLYDNDILLPHNLVRHYENRSCFVGFNKADVMKMEMDSMFSNRITSHKQNIFHVDVLPEGLTIDCTASKRSLLWSVSSEVIKKPMIRTEIYLGGKMGVSLLEGENRNPDVHDIQVSLYGKALDDDIIFRWLTYKQPEDMRYHIGFGCSSDTTILDDATISNHASVVPHLINKYQNLEKGIACVNIFDMDDLTNNKLCIYEIEPMERLQVGDGWSIHIRSSLYRVIQEYSRENLENAGLWIGCIEERIKRITVVDMFIPEDNVRENGTVTMGKLGVKGYLKKIATRTNGLIGYIGEWHTHTSSNASPSRRDIKTFEEMQQNAEVFLMSIISASNTQNFIIKRRK